MKAPKAQVTMVTSSMTRTPISLNFERLLCRAIVNKLEHSRNIPAQTEEKLVFLCRTFIHISTDHDQLFTSWYAIEYRMKDELDALLLSPSPACAWCIQSLYLQELQILFSVYIFLLQNPPSYQIDKSADFAKNYQF